jgi:iron complex outermembrane recepter protein
VGMRSARHFRSLDSFARWLISLAASVSLAGLNSPAAAQTAASDIEGLQEIVVTAEKRDSTVQRTPFSITAISGAQLAERGLSTLEDVAAETPGVSSRAFGPGQTEYEMRGLPSSGGSSATVGSYLNEIPLAGPAGAPHGKNTIDPDLFDLARVEILRGPQGTLYGSSSMGGTIRLITAPPSFDGFEAATKTALSGTEHGGFNRGGSAMVNLPLLDDRLAVRVVGTYDFTDGFIDRIVVRPFPIGPGGACGFGTCTRGDVQAAPVVAFHPRSNWERLNGGRADVLFRPNEALTVDLFGLYQGISMGDFSQADVPSGSDPLVHYQPFDISEPYHDSFQALSLTVGYDLGFAKLTSVTARWARNSSWVGETSEQLQSILSAFYGYSALLPVRYSNDDWSRQWSQEVRLTSTGDQKLQWVVGLFASDFKSIFSQYTGNPAYGAISVGGPAANPLGILYQAFEPYAIKQYAFYTEESYRVTDSVKLTLGARYFKYRSELTSELSGAVSETGNATQFTSTVIGENSGVNPKFNMSYEPTGDLTVYAQIAKGFRPGGVNQPVPVPPCGHQVNESYGPDSIWNYEIGEKARLLDGRLGINGDVYYIRWHNVQELLTQSCSFQYTANAGDAISYGPELELFAQLSPDLTFSLAGTHVTAHLTSLSAGVAGQTIGSVHPITANLPLQNVPKYTANATLNYSHRFSPDTKMTARLDTTWTGSFYDLNYYFTQLPGYAITNLRLGLLHKSLSTYLFANNLTNKFAELGINTMQWSLPVPSFSRPAVTTPRTIGVEVQYGF